MNRKQEITIEEWLSELVAASKSAPPEGESAGEIAARTGININRVRDNLRIGIAAGRIAVASARRPSIDGRMVAVPVYRVVKGKKA